jgi:hypothetical protein
MRDSLCGGLDQHDHTHAGDQYFYLIASEESGKIKDIQTELLESRGSYDLMCELKEDVEKNQEKLSRIETNQKKLSQDFEDLKKQIGKNQESNQERSSRDSEDLKKEMRRIIAEALDVRNLA